MKSQPNQSISPFIPASQSLPEITVKAVILGIILAIMMAASNAYLVLKAGLSISACIPAAVISMAVLKVFKKSNILENNIVQTTASAGEVLAASLAFTIPALVMLGYWNSFPYYIIASLSIVGGIFGVLLSIPLRRAMIIGSGLKFPEGIATAEVLKAGTNKEAARDILFAGLAAASIKFCQSGFQFLADSISLWGRVGSTVFGGTTGFSLALVGAGYVVGLPVALSLFSGAALAWFIGVPVYGALFGVPDAPDAYTAAIEIWNDKIRIIGVGMMVFGGFWMLLDLIKPIQEAISSSLKAFRNLKSDSKSILRTDLDIPITYVAFGSALLILPIYMIFDYVVTTSGIDVSSTMIMTITVIITFLVFIVSAMGASIASYMTGLLGSSNTPLSGVILMSILILSISLWAILSFHVDLTSNSEAALSAAAITLLVGGMVGLASAIGSENLQDLKAGQLVGATPWKQQVVLIIGVLASAIFVAPIFQLLFEAYGLGDVLPREGMDPTHALSAPKAALMAAVSQAIFTQTMDWTLILFGVGLGIVIIIIDFFLKKRKSIWRLPVIAVAVGIYMPMEITIAVLLGGLLAHAAQKSLKKEKPTPEEKSDTERRGILFASGLIAGEAIVGIFLAIPFVIYQSTHVFRFVPESLEGSTDVLGLVVFAIVLWWYYQISSKVRKS